MKKQEKGRFFKDRCRFWGGVAFLFVAGLILFLGWKGFFYGAADFGRRNWNSPRYFWCLAFGMIGFALTAIETSREDMGQSCGIVFYAYVKYLLGIMICTALIFVILNERESTRGFLFYYGGAALAFLAGYFIHPIIIGIPERLKGLYEKS